MTSSDINDVDLTAEQLNQLSAWAETSNKLRELKELELVQRRELVDLLYTHCEEGTHTINLPDEWQLKATVKMSRTIDTASLDAVLAQLPEGASDLLISYKANLNLSNYKKMSDKHKAILDEAIIMKEATPSLKLVAPK